jgi:hypothetical protein
MVSYFIYHSFLSNWYVNLNVQFLHLINISLGLFALAFARKAHNKFRDGFILDAHKFNKRALILCIVSIVCGVALIIGLLFGFDAWPRTNG